MPRILERYLLKQGLLIFFKVIGVIVPIIFLLEFIEQGRASHAIVISQIIAKLPKTLFLIFPFVVFLVFMLLFRRLQERSELQALLSFGLKPSQIFFKSSPLPILFCIFYAFILHPLDVSSYTTSWKLHNDRLWIQDHHESSYLLISAQHLDPLRQTFTNVDIYQFSPVGTPVAFFEAKKAILKNEQWLLLDGIQYPYEHFEKKFKSFLLASKFNNTSQKRLFELDLTQKIFFLKIPSFVTTIKKMGLPTTSYRYSFHSMIQIFVLFFSFLLISINFFMTPIKKTLPQTLISTLMVSIMIYFSMHFVKTMIFTEYVALECLYAIPCVLIFVEMTRKKFTLTRKLSKISRKPTEL